MKKILIPMAHGAADIELVSIIDIFRRAIDFDAELEIVCPSLDDSEKIILANEQILLSDTKFSEQNPNEFDAIVLAGGFDGMQNLRNDKRIIQILKDFNARKKLIAAICASPIVLAEAGVLSAEFSCYPGCEFGIEGKRLNIPVCVRENIITSAGPITTPYFVLSILKKLGFSEVAEKLQQALLINDFGIEY